MAQAAKIIFISWQPYCSRSDHIARELHGKSFMVYYEIFGSRYATIALKYIFQTFKTLLILIKNRPRIVFVMSPPLFACVPVFIYCKLFRRNYIIDAHTGAFTNPMWQKVLWLQKYFSRSACNNIITNSGLMKYLIDWEAPFIIISDVPIIAANTTLPKLEAGTNVTLINTFGSDEPIEEFLEAARKLGDINFHVTGKIKPSDQKYLKLAPANVKFTDYLDNDAYFGLMLASDLIIVLTKLDNTMQRGAYEAIYNGKPIVTSKWKVLKENFGEAAVLVENNAEDIRSGIRKALSNIEYLNIKAAQLKRKKIQRWEANKELLKDMIM